MNRLVIPLITLIFALTACAGQGSIADLSSAALSLNTTFEPDNPVHDQNATSHNEVEPALFPTSISKQEGSTSPAQIHASPTVATPRAAKLEKMPAANAVAEELASSIPPQRNDRRLATAYRGFSDAGAVEVPLVTQSVAPGTQETFTILNVIDKTISEIDAELLAVSDKAYFWFDMGAGSISPDLNELNRVSQDFDEIYLDVVNRFGSENSPGIDGDPRLHIVNASPIALCGVTEDTADHCILSGLVNSTDLLDNVIDPRSNEREMFVMNARRFGTDSYLAVLAHELRHLIEDNYDKSDTDWEVEGSAVLAAQLAGLPSSGTERANMFLSQPDQQLNSWVEQGTGPYYGQGYILNRYIYDQLGESQYRDFATSPLPGLAALDAIAVANGSELNGQTIWLNYLAALVIHDDPQAPAQYQFNSIGLNTAAATPITSLPASYVEQVSQFAADYYELPEGIDIISFTGATDVPILDVEPVSGDRYWFAQRANYSNPRLTFSYDLRDLEQATLVYDVYADIEQGYDFAYVSVSLDDGLTWIALEGDQMQGLDPTDNPAGSALTDRFYTGRIRRWVKESVDISGYAGEQILLRFEYVTDPILTYGGLAIDNITIPELGSYNGAEEDSQNVFAEGFTRATARIPQTWHLQYITYSEEGPLVENLTVDAEGELLMSFENKTQQASILIVAAAAPTTLEKAVYELHFE